jgi:hypothetical protein
LAVASVAGLFMVYAGPPMARGIIVVAVPALVAVTFVLWV